ncbi:MAG: hypothetical protein TREMPRED_004768, partial [Tremellales sp. Tagirdzhanova-0007]
MFWPTIVIALVTHIASVVFSIIVWRFGSTPDWIVESLTYNNVASYPLLLIYALYRVSPTDGDRGLSHLKWRVMDTTQEVLERSTMYILINLVVVELARSVLSPVIAKFIPAVRPAIKEEDTADEADPDPSEPTDLEDATERTPLVTPASQSQPKTSRALLLTLLSPILVTTVVGLLIGMIKPAQTRIV